MFGRKPGGKPPFVKKSPPRYPTRPDLHESPAEEAGETAEQEAREDPAWAAAHGLPVYTDADDHPGAAPSSGPPQRYPTRPDLHQTPTPPPQQQGGMPMHNAPPQRGKRPSPAVPFWMGRRQS